MPPIAVTSSALQGERTATSDVNGVFLLGNLPPGRYVVRMSKTGLATLERTATVPLGATATLDATLALAKVSESVLVEAATRPHPSPTIQTSANIRAEEINQLPMGRTPYLAAELMPGVTTNTPNANQIAISRRLRVHYVFLIDGVDVNDNLLGVERSLHRKTRSARCRSSPLGSPPNTDAFSGGVVNVITKSGGNTLSGSYRSNLSRPSWTQETPFEKANGIERGVR